MNQTQKQANLERLFTFVKGGKLEPEQDNRSFKIHGHRGARGLYPENTIVAFKKAMDLGVETLEMNVVISKDKKVVVSHEPWFSNLYCSKPNGSPVNIWEAKQFNIFEMNYEQIATFDCGIRSNPHFPKQEAIPSIKPLLTDVIDSLNAHAKENNLPSPKFSIELKYNNVWANKYHPLAIEFASLVYDIIEAYELENRASVMAFDVDILKAINDFNPLMNIGLCINNNLPAMDNISFLGFKPTIYAPHHSLINPELVNKLHGAEVKVNAWVVNSLKTINYLKSIGVDSVSTDYPNLISQL